MAEGELKTSSITISFIHPEVSQSWLKKTSIDCSGWAQTTPHQTQHVNLSNACTNHSKPLVFGAALNNCGSKVKAKLSRRDASLRPRDFSPNFMAPWSMGSTISTCPNHIAPYLSATHLLKSWPWQKTQGCPRCKWMCNILVHVCACYTWLLVMPLWWFGHPTPAFSPRKSAASSLVQLLARPEAVQGMKPQICLARRLELELCVFFNVKKNIVTWMNWNKHHCIKQKVFLDLGNTWH